MIVTPEQVVEFHRATGTVREVLTARALGLGPFLACNGRRAGGASIVAARGVVRVAPDGAPSAISPAPAWAANATAASIEEGRDGALWLALRRGPAGPQSQVAVRTDGTEWVALAEGDAAQGEWVAAWQGADDEWWLATSRFPAFDLTITVDGRSRVLPPARMLSGQLLAVTPTPDGGTWLATTLGLVRHSPAAWRAPAGGEEMTQPVGPLLRTGRGDLVAVQTTRLLHSADGARWHGHTFPQPLPGEAVYRSALLVNRGGAQLACRTAGGLLTLDPVRDVLSLSPVEIPGGTTFTILGATRDGARGFSSTHGARRPGSSPSEDGREGHGSSAGPNGAPFSRGRSSRPSKAMSSWFPTGTASRVGGTGASSISGRSRDTREVDRSPPLRWRPGGCGSVTAIR